MSYQTSCCFSTVKNISGGAKTFAFLPPHGRRLEINEEYSVFGDIREAIKRGDYGDSRRYMHAFERALATQQIYIVSTPAPVLEDIRFPGDATKSKVPTLLNGAIVVYDPCFESFSEDTDPEV